MLSNPNESQILATAFNRNHRQNAEGGALAPEFYVENVIDRVETTSAVWLGLTTGCARCHDHKIDPISIEDYYGLAGIFMSTKTLTKYSVVAEFHEHNLTEESHQKKWQEVRNLEAAQKKKETPKEEKERLGKEIAALKKDLPAPFQVMGVTEYPTQNVKVHLRGDYLTLGDDCLLYTSPSPRDRG